MADPDKGWQLPTVVDPEDYWCYTIRIPKDVAYLRAFRGAIGEMAYNWNWQRDAGHTASLVVQKWIAQLEEAELIFNADEGVCLEFCEEVLNCILTESDIQQAIANYALTSNIGGSTSENPTILAMDLVDNQAGCDNDNIYGMVLQLVNFLDEINKDILEQLIASTQQMDALGRLISAIPVVETIPLDEALSFTNWMLDTIYSAYLAASTELFRVEVACDLFCLAQDNGCTLSLEEARDYFNDKLAISLDTSNPTQFLEDLIANNLAGTATFYGMYNLLFQLMAFGSPILGYLPDRIVRLVQAMFNDPNSDWSTDCDACPTAWTWDSDFDNSKNIWEPQDDSHGQNASWSMGTGWGTVDKQVNSGAYFRQQNIDTDADFTPTTITKVVLTYDLVKGAYFNDTTAVVAIKVVRDGGGNEIEYLTESETSDGDGRTLEYTGSLTDVVEINVWVRGSISLTENYSGSCNIVSLHIEGDDFNPFV